MPQPIEIFRSGTHTPMRGAAVSFSNDDLDAIAAAYNADDAPAPLVIGHPKTEDMAHGWVKRLFREGDILFAEPGEVSNDLQNHVTAGRFKKVSASFFNPGSPANPEPKNYYLKHVGFLGAVPPAVTGLAPVSFAGSDDDSITIEFSYAEQETASLFGRLREFIIEKFSIEDADKVLPRWEVEALKDNARTEPDKSPLLENAALFAAPENPKEKDATTMTDEEKQALETRQAGLDAREEKLNQDTASFAANAAKSAAKEFTTALVQTGKLLPAMQENVASFMASLDSDESVSFAEGGDKSQTEFFKDFLNGLPKAVEFSEVSGGADDQGTNAVSFAAPEGKQVDSDRLVLHNKAIDYQTKNGGDYMAAVRAVGGA